jgi:hypothetical protein
LTGADTQRTLARVQLQYESHTNLELPAAGGSLPLAGALERPAPAVEAAASIAPAAPRRAQGPYSRPFNSLDDFIHAIEAAKERNYAPPPPAETQPQPAPQRTVGPYARPFQSMEDFVQAVNAARERNYAPPPSAEQLPPPAPRRETGPYARAFSSFEDFVKAVEETHSQWGAAAEEPAAPPESQPSVPPARVRPISRIEELPVRGEARLAASPIDLPAPPPELSRPTSPAQPAATQPPAHSQPAPTHAAPVPALQRSPLPSAFESSQLAAKAEPTLQRSATPPLQRAEPPTRSEPAAPTASDVIEPAATLPADTPSGAQPLDMPLVQRQPVERESLAELPAAGAEPIEPRSPIEQGQAAAAPPPIAVKSAPVVPPIAHADRPVVQRQPDVTPQPPVNDQAPDRAVAPIVPPEPAAPASSRPDMPVVQRQPEMADEEPIVQRQTAEALPHPASQLEALQIQAEPPAPTAPPRVQRQPAETPARSSVVEQAPAQAPESIEPQPAVNPVQPTVTAAPVAPLDMPLVQRQPVDEVIEPEAPANQIAPVRQQQMTEAETAAPHQPAASEPARPGLVQRQTAPSATPPATPQQRAAPAPQIDHGLPPAVDQTPARSIDLPVVQRQPIAPEAARPIESGVEASGELPTISRAPVAPPPPEKAAAMRPTSPEMPLVQRQTIKSPATAEEIDQTLTAQRQAEVTAPPPAELPTQRRVLAVPPQPEKTIAAQAARPEMPLAPVVQRQTVEATEPVEEIAQPTDTVQRRAEVSVPAPAETTAPPAEKKIVAPLTESKAATTRAEMPLVQRQPAEIESEAASLSAEATATPDVLQRAALSVEGQPELAAPRQSKLTAAESAARVAPAAHVVPAAAQPSAPSVQRHVTEPIDSARPAEPARRETVVVPPAPDAVHAPLDMPLVQPQPESQTASSAVAQRTAMPDESVAVVSQPTFDLGERILSRVAPSERRTTAKPVDLPLRRAPTHPESQPAPAAVSPTAREGGVTPFAAPVNTLSVAPSIQRMSEPVIQRTPIDSTDSSAEAGFIQRDETVPEPAAQPPEAAPVDLDQLARQVYPLIKRLIAIERERRAFR